jgi:hypothetical protein
MHHFFLFQPHPPVGGGCGWLERFLNILIDALIAYQIKGFTKVVRLCLNLGEVERKGKRSLKCLIKKVYCKPVYILSCNFKKFLSTGRENCDNI